MAVEIVPSVISKISVKTLGCDPKRAVKEEKVVPLCRMWGVAEAIKFVINRQTGDTNTALIGNFRGMNLETGELYQSGTLYLPAGMHDQIVAPLQRAKDQGATVEPIQFGLEVASRPAKNPVGYEYVGRPIVKPEGVDPLAAMEEKFDGLRQLPAPAKEAAKK